MNGNPEPIHDTTVRTTATSKAEGRLKVGIRIRKRKRKYLKRKLKS